MESTAPSTPAVSADAPPRAPVTCHAPLAGWQLVVLVVATATLYAPFWALRTWYDLRALRMPAPGPVACFLGYLLVFLAPIFGGHHASVIRRLSAEHGLPASPSTLGVIVLLTLYALGSTAGVAVVGDLLSARLGVLVVSVVMLCAALVLMNSALNRVKDTLVIPVFKGRPYRFRAGHYVYLALITLPVGALAVLWLWQEGELYAGGEPMATGQVLVVGEERFEVTVPSGWWNRVAESDQVEDAEFELYGDDRVSWAVAWYHDEPTRSLREIVLDRRDLIEEDAEPVDVREHRLFLSGTLVPVSHASYRPAGGQEVWWVSTVRLDEGAMEIVTYTPRPETAGPELSRLVKSLRQRRAP